MTVRAAGALAWVAALAGCGSGGSGQPPRTLVLLSLEDVRASDLDDARVMPAFEALRSGSACPGEGRDEALGPTVSLATLVTGLPARGHGLTGRPGRHRLGASLETLAEHLSAAGWRTYGAAASPILDERLSGLEQGFEVWTTPRFDRETEPWAADEVVERALQAASGVLATQARVFLWVHLADTRRAPPRPRPEDVPLLVRRLEPYRTEPEIAAALARLPADPAGALEDLQHELARWRNRPERQALDAALRDLALLRMDAGLERLLAELSARGRPPLVVVRAIPEAAPVPAEVPCACDPAAGAPGASAAVWTRDVARWITGRDLNERAAPAAPRVEVHVAAPGELRLRVVPARPVLARVGGGPPARRDEIARLGSGQVDLAFELEDTRPALEVQVRGAPVPPVVALPGAVLALPRLPPAPSAEWSSEEPPALEVERAAGRRLRLVLQGSGPAELFLCTWPPSDELDVRGQARIERLPGSDALMRASGPAPLSVEVLRPGGAELAISASVSGVPVPAGRVRWLGRAFQSAGRVALVVPEWLPPGMRASSDRWRDAVGLRVTDPELPADAWSVVLPEERRFLERRR